MQHNYENRRSERTNPSDDLLNKAFGARRKNFPVEGGGTVLRILEDDVEGDQHQRFIVRLKTGQTLLVVHNIDVAERVEPLNEGDTITFKGEYEWNDLGGVIHWTHTDPEGVHAPGWVEREGQLFG